MAPHRSRYSCTVVAAANVFDHEGFMQWANYACSCSRIREIAGGTAQIPYNQGSDWIDLNGIGSMEDFRMTVKCVPASREIECMILYRDGTEWRNLAGGRFDIPCISAMITMISSKVAARMGVQFQNVDPSQMVGRGQYQVALLFPESSCEPAPTPRRRGYFGNSGGQPYTSVNQDSPSQPTSPIRQSLSSVTVVDFSNHLPPEPGPSIQLPNFPAPMPRARLRDRRVGGGRHGRGRHKTFPLPTLEEMEGDTADRDPSDLDHDIMDGDFD